MSKPEKNPPSGFDLTELGEAAVQLHEMYGELKRSGFSRGEALELISRIVAQGIAAENDNPDEA